MTKHEQIEEIIMNLISQGLLKAGDQIPPIREMAKVHDMSITPVIEAYHNLENRGVIVPHRKSRFVISDTYKPVRKFEEYSPDNNLLFSDFRNLYSALLNEDGEYPFGRPDVYVDPLSNEEMLRLFLKFYKSRLSTDALQQDFGDCPDLQSQVCRWMIDYNCIAEPKDIFVTNGSMYSTLSLALNSCTRSGDLVGVAEPGSIAHYMAIRMNNLTPVPITMVPGQGIDLNSFEYSLQKHPEMKCVLITSNFDVPTGTLMSDSDKATIAEICRNHNIVIIEDDIFGSLNYEKYRPRGILSYAPERTIYVSGMNVTGIRNLGMHWIESPIYQTDLRYFRDQMQLRASHMLQYAYSKLLNSKAAARRRADVCIRHKEQADRMIHEIYSTFPSGTYVTKPDGGYFLWVRLPGNIDSMELLRQVYPLGISFTPGFVFSDDHLFSDHICLNMSVIDGRPEKLEGLRRLGEITETILQKQKS